MKLINALFLIAVFSLVGCAHGLMRGSVAMKTSDTEAHVCLGDKEVKVGDRVNAFTNYCPSKGGGRAGEGGGGTLYICSWHHLVARSFVRSSSKS